jgi:XTP/dITP diphosphohydrolase
MTTLVLATTNPNKVREIRALLRDAPVTIVGLDHFPAIEPPVEDGATFEENAAIKARYYAAATGGTVVAEDSGLEIDALGGVPGVDAAGGRDSTARFVCSVAVARGDEVLFSTRGTVEGRISPDPRGDHGFGYDPIFFYPPEGRTLAEVSDETKRAVSHRGAAFRTLAAWLEAH